MDSPVNEIWGRFCLEWFDTSPSYSAAGDVEVLTEAQTEIDAGQVRFYRILARKLQFE